jgi:hypothetical protein
MSFLEKIQIVSSKTHKIHHKHRLHNLTDVEVWNNLYIPLFINTCADNVFKYIIQLNNKNNDQIKMYNILRSILHIALLFGVTHIILLFIY